MHMNSHNKRWQTSQYHCYCCYCCCWYQESEHYTHTIQSIRSSKQLCQEFLFHSLSLFFSALKLHLFMIMVFCTCLPLANLNARIWERNFFFCLFTDKTFPTIELQGKSRKFIPFRQRFVFCNALRLVCRFVYCAANHLQLLVGDAKI